MTACGPVPCDYFPMKNPLRSLLIALMLFAAALPISGRAQITSWNAYSNFYLSPTAAGWGGATNPSAAGAAWGYYAANVNGFGFPTGIGSYFTPTGAGIGSQNMYQYSDVAPIGAGTVVGSPGYANAEGQNFGYYADTFSWGSSLGRYDTPWFGGAPGLSQGLTNLIWFQSGWLGGGASEGIAPVLTWTAPTNGTFVFNGLFVSGDQAANSAAVAIVDSLSQVLLSRTVLNNDSTQTFSFTNTYNLGDTVQFQVGNNFSLGNVVGLQLEVVPEPSTVALTGFGLAAVVLYNSRRKRLR